VANFSQALDLVYDAANTSLATAQRQSLVELVLATAAKSATPGFMHDIKAVVGRYARLFNLFMAILASRRPVGKLRIGCAVQIAKRAPAFVTNQ